ncbi:MAG: SoxR reducing system RseC family protein [bacterium]
MNENGVIVAVFGSTAHVEMVRSPACRTCGLCTSSLDEKKMVVEVKTVPGAKVGDQVVIEIKPGTVISSAIILYLIPLAGLFFGAVLGEAFFHREEMSLLLGLAGLAGSLALVVVIDRKLKKSQRFQPRIVEVMKS